MHELAICQSLLDQARQIVDAHDANGIERIIVQIGPLSGVEAPLLAQAFSIARSAAGFPNAELEIETSPIQVRCQQCGTTSAARVNALLCGSCQSWKVDLISGDEMILKSLILTEQPASLSGPLTRAG
ncbi:MAG: hydrogenase nickel incorporation protein HypA [Robiginitomaculum sp.]|nr:MAG: hydrogenase nickel incorporation protein HypA [Robiginitomaculum sp.]